MRRTLAVFLLLAACGGTAQSGKPTVGGKPFRPGDPIPAGGAPTVGVKVDAPDPGKPSVAATVSGRRRGVPHFAQISGIVVDAGGTRALTKDFLGQVRIWPTLDGKTEPQRVTVTSPEAMAIAARSDGGSLVGTIDASGIVTLLHLDAEGMTRATVALSPDVAFSGITMLDGGERIAVVRSDQRVILLDADGVEKATLAVRGARVIALHAVGDRLFAVLRKSGEAVAKFEVRALKTADDKLAWDGDARGIKHPVAMLPQVVSAVSPDGGTFAYLSQNDSGEVFAKMMRIDTGKEITFDSPVQAMSPTMTTMGFTDETHVEITSTGGTGWRAEIENGQAIALTTAVDSSSSAPAYARDLRIAGYQANLVVHRNEGDTMYLGYRDAGPSSGSLAPDGSCVAWSTGTGAIVVQRFDGSGDLRIKNGNDWFSTVSVVDEGHLIAGRSNGQIAMYDTHTGAELASAVVSTSSPYFQYQPGTGLLAVLRDSGTVWVLAVDASKADPFGDPIAVSDGATNFVLLDPDLTSGDALMTVDGSLNVRKYSQKTLEGGLSASEIKKAKRGVTTYSWGYTRSGEAYTLNGTQVELRDGDKVTSTITLSNAASSGIFVSPKGDQIGVSAMPGTGSTFTAVNRKGKELWSVASRGSFYWAAWSEDQTRAIVLGQGGAIIVDTSDGSRIASALGWAFDLSNEVPQSFPPGVDPGFE